MLRMILVSVVAAIPFTLAAMPVAPPPPSTNVIVHEPLIVYDNSGGTLAGLFDMSLTVYNDGWVRVSAYTSVNDASKSATAFIGHAAAVALAAQLSQLGGGRLTDQVSFALDLPTQTLTLLRDATDTRGHTYSWLEGNATYGPVEQRIQTFLAATFPNF
jgi:hypothetical protein